MLFVGPVVVELLTDGVYVKVAGSFTYIAKNGETYLIPAGFQSDGISLPRWAYTALGMTPFTTKARRAAILHDYLYARPMFDKAKADLLLREACIADGLEEWMADIVYAGVHVGGEDSYTADQAIAAAHDGALRPAMA